MTITKCYVFMTGVDLKSYGIYPIIDRRINVTLIYNVLLTI